MTLDSGDSACPLGDSLLRYFDLLEETINENGLGDKPAQLFNMDESGMPLDPKPPLLICQHGTKHPSSIGSGDKAQITVVGCVTMKRIQKTH